MRERRALLRPRFDQTGECEEKTDSERKMTDSISLLQVDPGSGGIETQRIATKQQSGGHDDEPRDDSTIHLSPAGDAHEYGERESQSPTPCAAKPWLAREENDQWKHICSDAGALVSFR